MSRYLPVLFVVTFSVSMPSPALAYIDPGTGSQILQIVIAGVVAAGFAVKTFWHRIRALFSGFVGKGKPNG